MLRSVLAACVLVATAAAAPAQPKRPADLFPAGTLAYAEIDDPAGLADAVAAMVKGSALEDGLKLLHDRRDANKDPRLFNGQPALSLLATATAAETLAEVRKLRGAAVGWTGFTTAHDPKVAAVVLFGDGSAAGLVAKAYLANEATFRRVDTRDGVPIFQARAALTVGYDPNTGKPIVPDPAKATAGPQEPTYAYTPGLFVVGSNVEAVADVLARYRGAAADSFAASDGYKALVAQRQAGVNYCVRLAELVAAADRTKKAGKDAFDPTTLAYLKLVVGGTAAPVLAGHLTLGPAGMTLTTTVSRDPGRPSPLLDLFADGLTPAALDVCPADFAAVATFALPKAGRAAAVLRLADAVARADGEVGKLPSDWLADAEQRTKVPLREKLLPAVRAVSVLLPSRQELPPKVEAVPFLALHFEAEADAEAGAAAVPALLAALRDVPPQRPTAETVSGVRVETVTEAGGPLHFARAKETLVVGRDRGRVAACLSGSPAHKLGRKLPPPDASTAAYAVILPLGLALSDQWGNGKLLNRLTARGVPDMIDGLPPGVLSSQPPFTDAELTAAFAPVPPVVARVTPSPGKLVVEVRLDCTVASVQKVIDAVIPVVEKVGVPAYTPNGRFFYDR